MNKLNIDDLVSEGFHISIADSADSIVVIFNGSIDIQEPQYMLEEYFDVIHEKALKSGLKQIYCDFKGLDYINSSGIKSLLKWILKNYNGLDHEQQYSYIFIVDNDSKWQADSIGFLKNIAPELIAIQN